MVIPTGFEPVASRLGILRSILLSYGTSHQKRPDIPEHFPTHTVFHGFRQPRKKRGRRISLHIEKRQAARAVSTTDTK